jgi:hypothetical protein
MVLFLFSFQSEKGTIMTEATSAATLAAATLAGSGDKIDIKETHTIEIVKPGFFSRLIGGLEKNPIKTAVSVSAGLGVAAVGTYNYMTNGNVLPPSLQSQGVAESVSAFGGFFGDAFR